MKTALQPNPKYYLGVIFALVVCACSCLGFWAFWGKDFPAAIPLHGDASYYLSFSNRLTQEIQDRDVFYHQIGNAIRYAKQADIVILGHSMALFALQADLLKAFEKKHGVKIYNLASAGDASGEFLRRIIQRWSIKPKMWIINADDFGGNFFYLALNDYGFGPSAAAHVIHYGRRVAYKNVFGRNCRWQLENLLLAYLPARFNQAFFHNFPGVTIWRNIADGHWYLDDYPSYLKADNPFIQVTRNQDCHASADEILHAKQYLAAIGNQPTVFTLVPYHQFCPRRVRELAKALHIETIIPINENYSGVDSGGHLDKKSAIRFTQFFLATLEKTETFKKLASR